MPGQNGAKAPPRLGGAKAPPRKKPERREVVLDDRGGTVMLEQPSVEHLLDLQQAADKAGPGNTAKDGYLSALHIVAGVMVDPKWSPDQLREEVDTWSFRDWNKLQDAALDIAGLKEEVQAAIAAGFPGASV